MPRNNSAQVSGGSHEVVETQIKNLTEDYVQRCIIKKKQLMIEECNRVLGKLGYSELETTFPKMNHSLFANREFIFITGGSHNDGEDRSFEILSLANDTLFRGPDLIQNRSHHASFVMGKTNKDRDFDNFLFRFNQSLIDNYLYVMFGSVLNSCSPSMSYEKIEIPTVGCQVRFYYSWYIIS